MAGIFGGGLKNIVQMYQNGANDHSDDEDEAAQVAPAPAPEVK